MYHWFFGRSAPTCLEGSRHGTAMSTRRRTSGKNSGEYERVHTGVTLCLTGTRRHFGGERLLLRCQFGDRSDQTTTHRNGDFSTSAEAAFVFVQAAAAAAAAAAVAALNLLLLLLLRRRRRRRRRTNDGSYASRSRPAVRASRRKFRTEHYPLTKVAAAATTTRRRPDSTFGKTKIITCGRT